MNKWRTLSWQIRNIQWNIHNVFITDGAMFSALILCILDCSVLLVFFLFCRIFYVFTQKSDEYKSFGKNCIERVSDGSFAMKMSTVCSFIEGLSTHEDRMWTFWSIDWNRKRKQLAKCAMQWKTSRSLSRPLVHSSSVTFGLDFHTRASLANFFFLINK